MRNNETDVPQGVDPKPQENEVQFQEGPVGDSDLLQRQWQWQWHEQWQEQQEQREHEQQKKRRAFKLLTVVVILLVVLGTGAGVGFAIFHDDPRFCNFVCHSPMDPYVEGYLSEAPNLLASAHGRGGTTCLECHEATFSEQANELVKWTTGDFKDPLSKRRLGTVEFCERCHAYESIAALTENYQGSGRNPHDSHLGKIECSTCHSVHGESELYCRTCHSNVEEPKKW
jgi:hypothetical protein